MTRERLLSAGFGPNQIVRLIENGTLIPVHRGVYVVIHASSPLAHECAAVLAFSPKALLSHWTAARLWKLPLPQRTRGIHVTVVGRRPGARPGVHLHYVAELLPSELRRHEGIPITSPSLTLLDLAGQLTEPRLAEALNEARVLRLLDDRRLRATLAAHPRRRGARALRRLLDAECGPALTHSEAERRALALMRRHGIEPDATNAAVGPYHVDFLFRTERLIVEVDGYRYHGTHHRFVHDRRRIAALGAMGFQVHPLTWDDITSRPDRAMADLRAALDARR